MFLILKIWELIENDWRWNEWLQLGPDQDSWQTQSVGPEQRWPLHEDERSWKSARDALNPRGLSPRRAKTP